MASSARPVRVEFKVVGGKEVERAFRSAKKRAEELASVEARAAAKSEKASERAARQREKSAESAARAESREARRAARETEREERRKWRIQQRSATMAGRYAKQRADAEIREARRAARAWQSSIRSKVSAVGRAGSRTMGMVRGVSGMATIGATAAIASGVRSQALLERRITDLINATRTSGGAAQVNRDDIKKRAMASATTWGLDPSEVVGGLNVVAERAGGAEGLKVALPIWDELTKTAKAYGIAMEDMGAVTAAAINTGVKKGPELTQLMLDLVEQGKVGQIEFRNLADELAKISAPGMTTAMNPGDVVRTMVGVGQIAARAKVSPEESRTAVAKMMEDFVNKSKNFKELGVNLWDPSGKGMRDPTELLIETISAAERRSQKTGTDMMEILGGSRLFTKSAKGVINPMIGIFRQAGGGEAGAAALRKEFMSLSGAKGTVAARDKSLALVMESPIEKMAVEVQKFNQEMGKLLPRLTELMPVVTKLTTALANIVVWAAENPFKSLGVVFATHLGAELSKAAIGDMINGLISRAAGGAGGMGTAGKLGAISVAAGTVYLAGRIVIDEIFEAGEKKGKAQFASSMSASNLVSAARAEQRATGTIGQDTREKLESARAAALERSKGSPLQAAAGGEAKSVLDIVSSLLGGPASILHTAHKEVGARLAQKEGATQDEAARDFAALSEVLSGVGNTGKQTGAALKDVEAGARAAAEALNKVRAEKGGDPRAGM